MFEVTDIVDRLHLENSFDVDSLPVRIVPVHPVADEVGLSIGRISIFRQAPDRRRRRDTRRASVTRLMLRCAELPPRLRACYIST